MNPVNLDYLENILWETEDPINNTIIELNDEEFSLGYDYFLDLYVDIIFAGSITFGEDFIEVSIIEFTLRTIDPCDNRDFPLNEIPPQTIITWNSEEQEETVITAHWNLDDLKDYAEYDDHFIG